MITVKIDLRPLVKALLFIGDQQRRAILRDALDRSASAMRQEAIRGIAEATNIASADVRRVLSVKPSFGGMVAGVKAQSGWLAASYVGFGLARQSSGISFAGWKGTAVLARHGFIASMSSGHVGAFIRKGKGRFPLHQLFGPNPAKEMVREDQPTAEKVMLVARETFDKRWLVQTDRSVKQAKSRFGL